MPDGKVTIKHHNEEKWIEVSDNGKGMTADDLATVFTDLGASGKRNEAEASGGFGLAKAAPLMMSDRLEVKTVARDSVTGQKIQHILNTNKKALLDEGSEVQSKPVPENTPTGTTVRAYLGKNYNDYAVNQFVRGASRSVRPPGPLEGFKRYSSAGSEYAIHKAQEPARKLLSTNIEAGGEAVANVDIYASPHDPTTTLIDRMAEAQGSIPVEVNNNGIYQFDHTIYLGGDLKIAGLPKRIAIDVKALVPEGHAEYPFSANRETLRDSVTKRVEELIQEKFVKPAQKEYVEFLSQKYNSLPTINTTVGPVPIYDAGARLEPHELEQLSTTREFQALAGEISNVLNSTLGRIASSDVLESTGLTGLGGTIKRVGIVLSPEIHGVYIPKPGTGGSEATVLINPLSFAEGTAPEEISSLVWHTIKHEILHDKIKGHYESFTTGEASLSHAIGRRHETEMLEALDHAYARPGKPFALREGLIDALQIYNKSRGREAREKDIFGGEKLTERSVQPAGAGAQSSNEGLRSGRTTAVPPERYQFE